MPSHWQREYMCSMCGGLMYSHFTEVLSYNRVLRRKSLVWLLCEQCVDRVRNMLIHATWDELQLQVEP